MILHLIRRWSSHRRKPLLQVGTALGIALVLNLVFGAATMHFENHFVICQYPSPSRIIQRVEQFRLAHADPNHPAVIETNDLTEFPVEFQEKAIHFVKGLITSEEVLVRAKLAHRRNLRMMERAGADDIIPAEGITDMLLTQEIDSPSLRHIFENLDTLDIPHRFTGRPLREIQMASLNHLSNLQVVSVLRNRDALMTPEKSFHLAMEDQHILLAAKRGDYNAFEPIHLNTYPLPQTA